LLKLSCQTITTMVCTQRTQGNDLAIITADVLSAGLKPWLDQHDSRRLRTHGLKDKIEFGQLYLNGSYKMIGPKNVVSETK
jgi:hypothetical protein